MGQSGLGKPSGGEAEPPIGSGAEVPSPALSSHRDLINEAVAPRVEGSSLLWIMNGAEALL